MAAEIKSEPESDPCGANSADAESDQWLRDNSVEEEIKTGSHIVICGILSLPIDFLKYFLVNTFSEPFKQEEEDDFVKKEPKSGNHIVNNFIAKNQLTWFLNMT